MQFRPPTKQFVLEMPAGLVDAHESASQAALRELDEETGYFGAVISTSPIVFSDPGLTNANMQLVTVAIDPSCSDPKQRLDEGEFIDVLQFPLDDLLLHLQQHCQVSHFKSK